MYVLCNLSKLLNIEPYDLMVPDYTTGDAVVISHHDSNSAYYYPDNENRNYKI